MTALAALQAELEERRDGWWERLMAAIPELAELDATPQSPHYHPEGDVGVHTRLAVAACPPGSDPDLPWAALLHDIGKPATSRREDDGRITTHGHDRQGAELAETILARLGMPEERRARIAWAIRHHMFHLSWQLGPAGELSRRQLRALQNPDFPLLLELLRVDSLASLGGGQKLEAYTLYRDLWRSLQPPPA